MQRKSTPSQRRLAEVRRLSLLTGLIALTGCGPYDSNTSTMELAASVSEPAAQPVEPLPPPDLSSLTPQQIDSLVQQIRAYQPPSIEEVKAEAQATVPPGEGVDTFALGMLAIAGSPMSISDEAGVDFRLRIYDQVIGKLDQPQFRNVKRTRAYYVAESRLYRGRASLRMQAGQQTQAISDWLVAETLSQR